MKHLDTQYQRLLLEALEDMMYKRSLQLEELKGGPLTRERMELTRKQIMLEELQRIVSSEGMLG